MEEEAKRNAVEEEIKQQQQQQLQEIKQQQILKDADVLQDQQDDLEDDNTQEDDIFYDSDNNDKDEELVPFKVFELFLIFKKIKLFSNCKPCPNVISTFLCGSDNRTYSSLCRLDYHNCIHATTIKVSCKGFCPCKGGWFFIPELWDGLWILFIFLFCCFNRPS